MCYVYGIAYGPRKVTVTADTIHRCVDLEQTPLALGLTATYDQGRSSYDLDWMGKLLTERGLPVRPGPTGIRGLVVRRAYTSTDRLARAGATAIG